MGRHARRAYWIVGVSICLLGMAMSASAQPAKVTICHATGSSVNPFVTISPNVNGVYHGHLGHADDVIPPFEFRGETYSLNWPSDRVDLVGGECVSRQPEKEPPEAEPAPPVEEEPPFTG
jgi:hypothetical protein